MINSKKLKKNIIISICVFLIIILSNAYSMEFEVSSFFQDKNMKFQHSFSKTSAIEDSCFFLIIELDEPVPLVFSENVVHQKTKFSDNVICRINLQDDFITINADNYNPLEFEIQHYLKPGDQYILRLITIEAYFIKLKLEPLNGNCIVDNKVYYENMSLTPGVHTIYYEKENYYPLSMIKFVDKEHTDFDIKLKEIPVYNIAIKSKPDEADIYIDGISYGKTDTLLQLKSGKYSIILKKKNYNLLKKDLIIEEGKDNNFYYNLIPKSFFLTIEPDSVEVILENIKTDWKFSSTIAEKLIEEIPKGKYRLKIKKDNYKTFSENFEINDTLSYKKNIILTKKMLNKTIVKYSEFRKKLSFGHYDKKNRCYGFRTTISTSKNLDDELIVGLKYYSSMYRNPVTSLINPFFSWGIIRSMMKNIPKEFLLFPLQAGVSLNFLGNTRYNIKPYFSCGWFPIFCSANRINFKSKSGQNMTYENWIFSYGSEFEYWMNDDISLQFSVENSKGIIGEKLKEASCETTLDLTTFGIGFSFKLEKHLLSSMSDLIKSGFDSRENGYFAYSIFFSKDKEDYFDLITGFEIRPVIEKSNIKRPLGMQSLISVSPYLLSYSKDNIEKKRIGLFMTNVGLKFLFKIGVVDFSPFFTFNWAPYSIMNSGYNAVNNFSANSFAYSGGLDVNLWLGKHAGFTIGASYTRFLDEKKIISEIDIGLDHLVFYSIKSGVNVSFDDIIKSEQVINNYGFFYSIIDFKHDYFHKNYGIELFKFTDLENNLLLLNKISFLKFDNVSQSGDIIYVPNIDLGLAVDLNKTSLCKLIPYISLGWDPLLYEFKVKNCEINSYSGNIESDISGRNLSNFCWKYGVDIRVKFKHFGFSIGFEAVNAFKEIQLFPESEDIKMDYEMIKFGIYF